MKTAVPNYYSKFFCKASECRHSCCIGWEIDIDDDSLELYNSIDGEFGKKLQKNIICEDDTANFKLDSNERCPFLNSDNLCDIYINLGEECLCQICTDHPRYRNYINGRCEIGLGLTCEASGELILTQKEPTEWIIIEDDEEDSDSTEWERELYIAREKFVKIIQDRTKTIEGRIDELLSYLGAEDAWFGHTVADWREFYKGLERMDSSWDEMLDRLTDENAVRYASCELLCENLLIYFVNRHVTNAIDEYDLSSRLSFAILSCAVICTIAADSDFCDIVEVARMYSSEIEYSEDNTDAVMYECCVK